MFKFPKVPDAVVKSSMQLVKKVAETAVTASVWSYMSYKVSDMLKGKDPEKKESKEEEVDFKPTRLN